MRVGIGVVPAGCDLPGRVYLGSKRHVLEQIFSDRNQPFWRSAKRIEIGVIEPSKFAPFLRERFADSDRRIADAALERLLSATRGHPYATQEMAYYTSELVPAGDEAGRALVKNEIVGRDSAGRYTLVEPFLAEWLVREQRQPGLRQRLRL